MIKEVAAGWEDAATAERTMNDTKNHIQRLRVKEPGREGGAALALF
jgi:hypothetical protein